MDGDTSPEQQERYHALLRRMSPVQRLEKAAALSRAVRTLAEAGIRQRHPDADANEVRARLVVRLYGKDAARRLHLAIPDDAV